MQGLPCLSLVTWVQNQNDLIGGHPKAGLPPKFSIPNLLYDWVGADMSAQEQGSEPLISIQKVSSYNETLQPEESKGLYNKSRSRPLVAISQLLGDDSTIAADQYYQAIRKVRGPTKYEALNYLIPLQTTKTKI